ncbi:NfeD family protein [candidate division KSB1 bacterium]|nr:NfeD family protein [candidate division KSB1 bacterium]
MERYIWLVWFGAALIFFVIEIMTPTFFVVCLGIGCLVAAGASLLLPGESYLWIHLASFGFATFGSFIAIQPLAKRLKRREKLYRTNIESLIGETGVVKTPVGPGLQEGKVILQGSIWRAVAYGNERVQAGEHVQVVQVEGTKLVVRALSETREKNS